MRTQIKDAIQKALQGSRQVKITFKREAINEVNYLLGLANSGIISLNSADAQLLKIIVHTRSWSVDSNRTLTVTLTPKFDEEWFVQRLWRALEKIEAVVN